MDYTARYGLEFNPFLKNSKEVLVETQEYKEVLLRAAQMQYYRIYFYPSAIGNPGTQLQYFFYTSESFCVSFDSDSDHLQ